MRPTVIVSTSNSAERSRMRFLEDVGMSPFMIAIRIEVSFFGVILDVLYLLLTSTVILTCAQRGA
jgi:hypothetical protein